MKDTKGPAQPVHSFFQLNVLETQHDSNEKPYPNVNISYGLTNLVIKFSVFNCCSRCSASISHDWQSLGKSLDERNTSNRNTRKVENMNWKIQFKMQSQATSDLAWLTFDYWLPIYCNNNNSNNNNLKFSYSLAITCRGVKYKYVYGFGRERNRYGWRRAMNKWVSGGMCDWMHDA